MGKQLIVIGGGAAGFFCAINAARMDPSLRVMIVEKTGKLLGKVKVSGGGRCNVTHACFDIAVMSRNYPRGTHFVKKAFHQFFTTDTLRWFEERGVQLKTEGDGRMFPVTNSSQTIIDCLMREAEKYKVEIRLNTEVKSIAHEQDRFMLNTGGSTLPEADYICIACGGYPKSSMFQWLTALGHSIEEPVPSLFTFNMPGNAVTQLMGVSVPTVNVRIPSTRLEEEGPLLITHWGMSGPVILRLSAWGAVELQERNYEFRIEVNWLPEYDENRLREKFQQLRVALAPQKVVNRNPFGLPQRLWEFFLLQIELPEAVRWADLPAKAQNKLIKNLCAGEFVVKGKTTFKEEFVTAGGIKLAEVDPNTFMSKKIPNLFFAGEILNVDGITGGFNFQHAWTSGFVAAKSIAGDV